jgi:hypothetical protein
MTFETMMLRTLFGACVLVCGLALASMLSTKSIATQLANSTPAVSAAVTTG